MNLRNVPAREGAAAGLVGSPVHAAHGLGDCCFAEHDLDMIVGLKAASLQTFLGES
jgi:hypothetical protein